MENILYKYKAFSVSLIKNIIDDCLYFSSPRNFNDPMDCRPTVKIDTSIEDSVKLLHRFISINSLDRTPSSTNYQGHADQRIKQIEELASILGRKSGYDDALSKLICTELENEIQKRYNIGVLCLSETHDSPLMWSHYADQHNGICLGYIATNSSVGIPKKVIYGEDRTIYASEIIEACHDISKWSEIFLEKAFLRKAKQWEYEREWRVFGKENSCQSGFRLKEVIFGMRCEESVIVSILRLLSDKIDEIDFYRIIDISGDFNIKMTELHPSKFIGSYTPRHRR